MISIFSEFLRNLNHLFRIVNASIKINLFVKLNLELSEIVELEKILKHFTVKITKFNLINCSDFKTEYLSILQSTYILL